MSNIYSKKDIKRASNRCSILSYILISVISLVLLSGCGKNEPDNTAAPTEIPVQNEAATPGPVAPTNLDKSGKYTISDKSGEAIINDVDLSHLSDLGEADNARAFYHIFVGSFSDSNGDGIGDLRGIINRMDYLNDGISASGESLGVEGIWLSPIFASPSYHKYDTTDYYRIDSAFGNMDDLKELVELCHERNVKIILDLVINHTGNLNSWFVQYTDARKKEDTSSPYYSFYSTASSARADNKTFSKISGTDYFYECNFSGSMPEPDYDNPFVYDTFVDVAKYYLTDIGVDGFRFDAAKYIYFNETKRNVEFWTKYMNDLRAIKPDMYAVAEVWDSDSMTLEYSPAINCFDFSMAQVDGLISATTKHGDVNGFVSYIESYYNMLDRTRPDSMLVSFIANHDTDRAAGYMTYSSGYAKMAANLYLLCPGSSFIYYGEEIGMKGSRGAAPTDANRRLAMLWGDSDTIKNPSEATFDASKQTNGTAASMKEDGDSLLNHYKRLLLIRKANPEIASGEFRALKLQGTKAGGFVSSLTKNGTTSSVVVFHNTTGSPVTVNLDEVNLLDGESLSSVVNLNELNLAAVSYSSMEFEKHETTLAGNTLTIAEQSSAVLR